MAEKKEKKELTEQERKTIAYNEAIEKGLDGGPKIDYIKQRMKELLKG